MPEGIAPPFAAALVRATFDAAWHDDVSSTLDARCGATLPLMRDAADPAIDRIRCAVLRLADGDVEALARWIDAARVDWRDVLVAAGFGHDPRAHERWARERLGG